MPCRCTGEFKNSAEREQVAARPVCAYERRALASVLRPTLAISAAWVADIPAAISRSPSLSLGSMGVLNRDGWVPPDRRWWSRMHGLQ